MDSPKIVLFILINRNTMRISTGKFVYLIVMVIEKRETRGPAIFFLTVNR